MNDKRDYFISFAVKVKVDSQTISNGLWFIDITTEIEGEITPSKIASIRKSIREKYDLCYATILNIVSLDSINNKDKIYEEKWNNLKEYLKHEINSDGKSSIETETLENVLDMMNLED